MPYNCSAAFVDFEKRVLGLRSAALLAYQTAKMNSALRDLVFQCCILQCSAAFEDYIRSVFDGWAFSLKTSGASMQNVPTRARAFMAKTKVEPYFNTFIAGSDETKLIRQLEGEAHIWSILNGTAQIPKYFEGKNIYIGRKYPSPKNIRVLFSRIGLDDIFDQLSKKLRTDSELRLEGFNSIRTALAHSSPPNVTYKDVRDSLLNIVKLVRAMDRILYRHLTAKCAFPAW